MERQRLRSSKLTIGLFAVCLLAIAPAIPLWAQGDSGQKPALVNPPDTPPAASPADKDSAPTPAAQISSTSNLVTMPVTVTDRDGNFVYDLDRDDFQVFDNNKPQRITLFNTENHPVVAVILVQNNEQAAPLLGGLTNIAPVVSQLLAGPDGRVAVLLFSDRVNEVLDFTNSPDALEKTFKTLGDQHMLADKARLNDALARAIAMLEQQPRDDRRLILAISTGSDSGSETSQAEVVRRATAGEVTIYGLRLSHLEAMLKKGPEAPANDPLDIGVERPMPPGMAPTPDMSARLYGNPISGDVPAEVGGSIKSAVAKTGLISKSDLAFLSQFTGGVYYSQWTNRQLQADLDRISAEVHTQYEVAYIPNNLTQTGFHRIEVRLVNKPHMKVRTREGYFFYNGQIGRPPSRVP